MFPAQLALAAMISDLTRMLTASHYVLALMTYRVHQLKFVPMLMM
jgi:hypothetical protein